MSKRIRKNAYRQIEKISNRTKEIKVFTLDNCFSGESINLDEFNIAAFINKELASSKHVSLSLDDNGLGAVLHVHSNLWYTLTLAPEKTAKASESEAIKDEKKNTVTHCFLTKHRGDFASTSRDIVDIYNPGIHQDLLGETRSVLMLYDDFQNRTTINTYKLKEVDLPEWMDPVSFGKNNRLRIDFKWFVGFGGDIRWGKEWFEKIAKLESASKLAAIRLLRVKKFRSSFRASLREQLESWLNGENDYESPFSPKQWRSLINCHLGREASRLDVELYNA